MSTRRAST